MLVIILLIGADLRGETYPAGLINMKELFGIVGMFLVLGAPIAYAVMLVFGLPVFYLTRRFTRINFWSITLGAAFVAVIPVLLFAAPNFLSLYADAEKSSLLFYLAFAVCGYSVGLVFWFVSGLHKTGYPASV